MESITSAVTQPFPHGSAIFVALLLSSPPRYFSSLDSLSLGVGTFSISEVPVFKFYSGHAAYVPSNTMPSGRNGVWSELSIVSRSFGTLVFPFHEGTYVGHFATEHNDWISSSTSSYSFVVAIRACKSSSSSSISIMTAFPFYSIDKFLCRGFLGYMHTGPIAYLFFFGRGVSGDLGISVTTPAPSGTSYTMGVYAALPTVPSSIPNPSLVAVIISTLDSVSCKLRGSIITWLATLCALLKHSILK